MVVEARRVDDELLEAFARLTPQLSSTAAVPGDRELSEMVAAPGTRLLLARDEEGTVVGTLTLVLFRIPTGVRGWVEDVVVDRGARRKGIGRALLARAVELAAEAGARTVDLTSRPERDEANRLYQQVGFRRRDTNVYRWTPG